MISRSVFVREATMRNTTRSATVTAIFLSIGGFVLPGAMATSIHEAASLGDVAALQERIDSGAAIDALDASGNTPLIEAAFAGEAEAALRLLAAGATVDARSDRGLTALHAAAYRGHLDVVRLLIDHGADINDQSNKFRITPLHAAAEEDRVGVAALLISEGAELDLMEANAITPLSRAGWGENWEIFEMLRRAGAKCQSADVVGPELYERCLVTGQ
jgi:ankyrin repeat protein